MSEDIEIETRKLSLWYGDKQALKNIDMKIPEEKVTAIIGPSGCGKSTLIRCFNRMNDIMYTLFTCLEWRDRTKPVDDLR